MMGQSQDRHLTPREPFDENSNNGLTLSEVYIPEEILIQLLCLIDHTMLLNCQLVCKRWALLIRRYVWRRKAELTISQSHGLPTDLPWNVYYIICKKRPFERNLLKNHSGQYGTQTNWKILNNGGDHWKVEETPVAAPALPKNDPVFEGFQSCFVTSYSNCTKIQMINLEAEGLTSYILDILQPPIVISEWYCCRWDCPAIYEFSAELMTGNTGDPIIEKFYFRDDIVGEKQNKWHHVCYEFKEYGPGLKNILFCHGGMDKSFWAGHYGSKMAGACVCVKLPKLVENRYKKADIEGTSLDID